MDSEASKTKQELEAQAALESALARKQLELEYLEQLIAIASAELKIDIKKEFDSKLLSVVENKQEKTSKK